MTGKRNKQRMGKVADSQKRVRPVLRERRYRDICEGKGSETLYCAIYQLMRDMGYDDDAVWHLNRSTDTPFRKEGRAIIPAASFDELIITAPRKGAILLYSIEFSFPEPIGRQNGTVTILHKNQRTVLGFQSTNSGGGAGPGTIYDSLLHNRFLVENQDTLSFVMANTNIAAQAYVDFVILGKIVGGGYRTIYPRAK